MKSEVTYIRVSSEWFRGVVGPFASRLHADKWASESLGGSAEWEGATVASPGEAKERYAVRAAAAEERERA